MVLCVALVGFSEWLRRGVGVALDATSERSQTQSIRRNEGYSRRRATPTQGVLGLVVRAGWLPSSNCDYSYISTCNSTPCCRHRRTGELLSPPLGSSLVPAARHATLLLPSPAPAFHYNQGSTVVFGRPATRRLLNLDQNGVHGPHRAVLNPCMVVWPHYEYIHTARRAAPPSFSHHSLLRLGCAEVQPHSQLCRPAPSPTP